MDYSKLLYRLVFEVPQKSGNPPEELAVLPQAYCEHRFSDYFIYAYRDGYVDVYEKTSMLLFLKEHTYKEVIEYQQKWLLVRERKTNLWGAYDFKGQLVREIKFISQQTLISSLNFPDNFKK